MRRLSPSTSQQLHVLIRTSSAEPASHCQEYDHACTPGMRSLVAWQLPMKHQATLWMASVCVGRCLCPTKAPFHFHKLWLVSARTDPMQSSRVITTIVSTNFLEIDRRLNVLSPLSHCCFGFPKLPQWDTTTAGAWIQVARCEATHHFHLPQTTLILLSNSTDPYSTPWCQPTSSDNFCEANACVGCCACQL